MVVLLALAALMGVAALALAIVGAVRRRARHSIAPRVLVTELAEPTVRALFKQRASRNGWLVVDDGSPMVAQSSVLQGGRDRIYLHTRSGEHGRLHVEVGPAQWEEKWGFPVRAHSISQRIESFLEAVTEKDPSVRVTRAVLLREAAAAEPRGRRLPGRT